MGRLDGKVIIITGAGGGVGNPMSLVFAQEGAKVVAAEYVEKDGEEAVRLVKEAGGEAIFVKTDISNSDSVQALIKKTLDTYGKLNALVNTAAICPQYDTTVTEVKEEDYERIMAINLKGTWLLMKYTIPEMIKGGGGAIVNFSSAAGHMAHPIMPIYSTTKAGVSHITRCAAAEYGLQHVRVNAIAPGPIATKMMDFWSEETKAHFNKETPDGRMAKPEEIAQLALFLVSDESSHITGQTVFCDGGFAVLKRIG